jgi:esterase/lipase
LIGNAMEAAMRSESAGEGRCRRWPGWAALGVAAASLLAGCGGSGTGGQQAPDAGVQVCGETVQAAHPLRFPASNGANLNGVVLGDAPAGVVLARDLCTWLPYGKELAARGYQVLVFDFEGSGESKLAPGATQAAPAVDVAAATAALRSRGVTKVVLLGGSLGATVVLGAAAIIAPPVDGVISLSAPDTYQGVDATKAVPKLTMPVLFVAAERDGNYAESARAMYAASKQQGRKLLVVPGSGSHSTGLLDLRVEPSAKQVRSEIEAFLQANAK